MPKQNTHADARREHESARTHAFCIIHSTSLFPQGVLLCFHLFLDVCNGEQQLRSERAARKTETSLLLERTVQTRATQPSLLPKIVEAVGAKFAVFPGGLSVRASRVAPRKQKKKKNQPMPVFSCTSVLTSAPHGAADLSIITNRPQEEKKKKKKITKYRSQSRRTGCWLMCTDQRSQHTRWPHPVRPLPRDPRGPSPLPFFKGISERRICTARKEALTTLI
jgi:hypothetical protein